MKAVKAVLPHLNLKYSFQVAFNVLINLCSCFILEITEFGDVINIKNKSDETITKYFQQKVEFIVKHGIPENFVYFK